MPYNPGAKCPPRGYKPRPFPKPLPGQAPQTGTGKPVVNPPAPKPVHPKPPVVKPPMPKPSKAPVPVQPTTPTKAPTEAPIVPPMADLISLHLTFDRHWGEEILDSSSKLNNGIATNVRITSLPQACGLVGIFSKGNVSFDGKAFSPKPSTAVTIAMWIKLTSLAGQQSLFDAIPEGYPPRPGVYHFEVIDGKVRWFARDLDGKIVFNVTTDRVVVPPNMWIHLVGTYDKRQGWYDFVQPEFMHLKWFEVFPRHEKTASKNNYYYFTFKPGAEDAHS